MPLELVQSSVVEIKADGIVTYVDPTSFVKKGIDLAVHQIAGNQLMTEWQKKAHTQPSDLILTPGFDLPASFVLHVVAPIWSDDQQQNEATLKNMYTRCLQVAKANNFESIAFPPLPAYSQEKNSTIASQIIKQFLQTNDMLVYLSFAEKDVTLLNKSEKRNIQQFITLHLTADTKINFNLSEEKHFNYKRKASLSKWIIEDRSLDDVVDEIDETFSDSLFRLIREKKLDDVHIYKRANLDRRLFSKIRSDSQYQPSKTTALALCIALRLSLDETKDLLTKAGYALSTSQIADVIILYFIEHKTYDVYEINRALFEYGQKTLGSSYYNT